MMKSKQKSLFIKQAYFVVYLVFNYSKAPFLFAVVFISFNLINPQEFTMPDI